ncbi:MAG: alpha-N-acetylglucosaminidase N-terminal domain-containing protein, partial [Akkermansia sp.]|nr:alpha-N-acetylglucosaminidase N-terminal domain-containing protein [Akkermansia sp.]
MPLACMVASAQDPAVQPAAELVKRVTPEWADKVVFQIDNTLKSPVISSANQQIHIAAPNVLECIRGYGYYLRKIALVHLSWNGDNYNPAKIIFPKNSVTVPETLPFNYALNYCTLSYSCAHWDKKKWEK